MKKLPLLGLLIMLVAIGLSIFFLSSEPDPEKRVENNVASIEHTSEKSKPTMTEKAVKSVDFSDAARYAFVTDKVSPTLAVVDMLEHQAVQNVMLNAPAELIGISKTVGFIAYAKRGDKIINQIDLATLKQTTIAVKHPILDLLVHGDGQWLVYSSEHSINIVALHTGTESSIATTGETSVVYHPTNDSLFIAELEHGRLQRIELKDNTRQTLFTLEKPMSPISVMPNGMAVFFVAEGIVQRYSLLDEAIIPLQIKASPYRPYMTSDSRMLLAVNDQQPAELLAINTYTYEVKARFPLKNWQTSSDIMHDFIVTGWLEKVAVLADDTRVYSLSFDQANSLTVHEGKKAKGAVQDMLVQADSKTLLLTRQGSQKLEIFDMKNQQFSEDIALDLTQPDQVIMGETNTLCH